MQSKLNERNGGQKVRRLKAYRKTISIVNETTVELYENLVGRENGFLLESYDKFNGRYSIFGKKPEAIITSSRDGLIIHKSNGEVTVKEGNPYIRLKEFYSEFHVEKEDGDLAFAGGLVGSIGYDFIRYVEELPDTNEDAIGIETIQLMLVTEFVVIDHEAETLSGVVLEEDTKEGRIRAAGRIQTLLVETMNGCHHESKEEFIQDGIIIEKTDSIDQYGKKVERIKEYIKEGHIFQTVLSQRWTVQTKQDGFTLYKRLRVLNPSPYLYYFKFSDFEIIGSSPEMLVKKTGEKVQTCPIAGTRKRGSTKEDDERLKKELLEDEKERAEHVMLVDLARNDMGRISQFGTVKVKQFMEVQNYSHVMHIVSLVEGKKQGEQHPFDLIASFLPAGTLSGAPKIRAMEIIDELETCRRGLYGGATGYLAFDGDMDFAITIRTMVKKADKVYLQAGAGIVLDSVPENEYYECCNKVMALAKTLVREENL